jgi:hypothetical protein
MSPKALSAAPVTSATSAATADLIPQIQYGDFGSSYEDSASSAIAAAAEDLTVVEEVEDSTEAVTVPATQAEAEVIPPPAVDAPVSRAPPEVQVAVEQVEAPSIPAAPTSPPDPSTLSVK